MVQGHMPVGRYGCSAAVNSENKWVIHGGISRCQDYILSDTYEFDFHRRRWSPVACHPTHRTPCVLVPRTGHVGMRPACLPELFRFTGHRTPLVARLGLTSTTALRSSPVNGPLLSLAHYPRHAQAIPAPFALKVEQEPHFIAWVSNMQTELVLSRAKKNGAHAS
jgi:hypothetical protein